MVRALLASPLLVVVACVDLATGDVDAVARGAAGEGSDVLRGELVGDDRQADVDAPPHVEGRARARTPGSPLVEEGLADRELAARMPGPHRGRSDPARLAANDACVSCHPDAAAEWSRSRHRVAFTDPDFAGAYAREPTAFCRGCHAPEAAPKEREAGPLAAIGVACVTCHQPEGASLAKDAVLTATRPGDAAEVDRGAPHPVIRDPEFARAGACASCHDFDHPGAPGVPMQSTAREHRASSSSSIGCPSCHLRGGDPGAAVDHSLSGARDPERLRAALVIDAARLDDASLRVRLEARAIGHAFPTGDMFRRVVVEASAVDEDGDLVADDRRILATTYEDRRPRDVSSRVVVADDRLSPDRPQTIDLDLDGAAGLAVAWRVVYQRMDQSSPTSTPRLLGEVVLAAGQLPAEGGGR